MVRILVIDDEPDILDFTKKTLEVVKHEVDLAADGAIGLEMIKNREYELIITDVMMPNLTGLELTRQLKRDSRWKSIPILMFSALGTGTRMMLGEDSQADGYLQKPFTPAALLETVSQILRTKRTRAI